MYKYEFPFSDDNLVIQNNSDVNEVRVLYGVDHIASYHKDSSEFNIYHPEIFDKIPEHEKINVLGSSFYIEDLDLSFNDLYDFLKKN